MIHFVVALAAEAQPLVERFRMERVAGPYRTYRGDGTALVVSGIGKRAAAAATAFLFAKAEERPGSVFLNIGAVGHSSWEPGRLVLAHAIRDEATGEQWFPPRLGLSEIPSSELVTVDRPETAFSSQAAYDMEASGFYPTALSLSTAELVACLKVVSDNRESSWKALTSSKLRELVESNLGVIARVVAFYEDLSREIAASLREPAAYDAFRERWHFTATQANQLRRLLQRWEVLAGSHSPSAEHFSNLRRGGEVLRKLEKHVLGLALESELR